MNYTRVWLAFLAVCALGSIAVAAVWQHAPAESHGSVDTAPASRSIFPKVLNH